MKENFAKTTVRILTIILLIFSLSCSFVACDSGGEDESPGGESTSKHTTLKPSASGESGTGQTGSEQDTSLTQSTQGGTSGSNKPSSGTMSPTKAPSNKPTKTPTKGPTATAGSKPTAPSTSKSNTYYAPIVYGNSAPGSLTYRSDDGAAIIDYSNSASGYIMVRYDGAYSNLRVIVSAPNGAKPQYPIYPGAGYYALPLTGGSGTYSVAVYGNNGGNSYYTVGSTSISVSLSYSTVAFYRPNIFCNYNSGTSCVQAAANLTRGCDTDVAKVSAIYNYVVKNFRYDYNKASSVASTAYVPNLNSVWASKSGICFDYASTMAAMLRTQGIPTRVEVGYANGSTYHAWISCYIKGSGWVNDVIYFNGTSWKLMDPTFASTGGIQYDWSKKCSYSIKYLY